MQNKLSSTNIFKNHLNIDISFRDKSAYKVDYAEFSFSTKGDEIFILKNKKWYIFGVRKFNSSIHYLYTYSTETLLISKLSLIIDFSFSIFLETTNQLNAN